MESDSSTSESDLPLYGLGDKTEDKKVDERKAEDKTSEKHSEDPSEIAGKCVIGNVLETVMSNNDNGPGELKDTQAPPLNRTIPPLSDENRGFNHVTPVIMSASPPSGIRTNEILLGASPRTETSNPEGRPRTETSNPESGPREKTNSASSERGEANPESSPAEKENTKKATNTDSIFHSFPKINASLPKAPEFGPDSIVQTQLDSHCHSVRTEENHSPETSSFPDYPADSQTEIPTVRRDDDPLTARSDEPFPTLRNAEDELPEVIPPLAVEADDEREEVNTKSAVRSVEKKKKPVEETKPVIEESKLAEKSVISNLLNASGDDYSSDNFEDEDVGAQENVEKMSCEKSKISGDNLDSVVEKQSRHSKKSEDRSIVESINVEQPVKKPLEKAEVVTHENIHYEHHHVGENLAVSQGNVQTDDNRSISPFSTLSPASPLGQSMVSPLCESGNHPESSGNHPESSGNHPNSNQPESSENQPESSGNQPQRSGTNNNMASSNPFTLTSPDPFSTRSGEATISSGPINNFFPTSPTTGNSMLPSTTKNNIDGSSVSGPTATAFPIQPICAETSNQGLDSPKDITDLNSRMLLLLDDLQLAMSDAAKSGKKDEILQINDFLATIQNAVVKNRDPFGLTDEYISPIDHDMSQTFPSSPSTTRGSPPTSHDNNVIVDMSPTSPSSPSRGSPRRGKLVVGKGEGGVNIASQVMSERSVPQPITLSKSDDILGDEDFFGLEGNNSTDMKAGIADQLRENAKAIAKGINQVNKTNSTPPPNGNRADFCSSFSKHAPAEKKPSTSTVTTKNHHAASSAAPKNTSRTAAPLTQSLAQKLRTAFSYLDEDQDGWVCKADLERMMALMKKNKSPLQQGLHLEFQKLIDIFPVEKSSDKSSSENNTNGGVSSTFTNGGVSSTSTYYCGSPKNNPLKISFTEFSKLVKETIPKQEEKRGSTSIPTSMRKEWIPSKCVSSRPVSANVNGNTTSSRKRGEGDDQPNTLWQEATLIYMRDVISRAKALASESMMGNRDSLDSQMSILFSMQSHYKRIANAKPSIDSWHYRKGQHQNSKCYHAMLSFHGQVNPIRKKNGRLLPMERMHLILAGNAERASSDNANSKKGSASPAGRLNLKSDTGMTMVNNVNQAHCNVINGNNGINPAHCNDGRPNTVSGTIGQTPVGSSTALKLGDPFKYAAEVAVMQRAAGQALGNTTNSYVPIGGQTNTNMNSYGAGSLAGVNSTAGSVGGFSDTGVSPLSTIHSLPNPQNSYDGANVTLCMLNGDQNNAPSPSLSTVPSNLQSRIQSRVQSPSTGQGQKHPDHSQHKHHEKGGKMEVGYQSSYRRQSFTGNPEIHEQSAAFVSQQMTKLGLSTVAANCASPSVRRASLEQQFQKRSSIETTSSRRASLSTETGKGGCVSAPSGGASKRQSVETIMSGLDSNNHGLSIIDNNRSGSKDSKKSAVVGGVGVVVKRASLTTQGTFPATTGKRNSLDGSGKPQYPAGEVINPINFARRRSLTETTDKAESMSPKSQQVSQQVTAHKRASFDRSATRA